MGGPDSLPIGVPQAQEVSRRIESPLAASPCAIGELSGHPRGFTNHSLLPLRLGGLAPLRERFVAEFGGARCTRPHPTNLQISASYAHSAWARAGGWGPSLWPSSCRWTGTSAGAATPIFTLSVHGQHHDRDAVSDGNDFPLLATENQHVNLLVRPPFPSIRFLPPVGSAAIQKLLLVPAIAVIIRHPTMSADEIKGNLRRNLQEAGRTRVSAPLPLLALPASGEVQRLLAAAGHPRRELR